MIQSMTGYAKSEVQISTGKITIEIKSLNSKNLDLNLRLPAHYKEKELYIGKKLANNLIRGKIDFSIRLEKTEDKIVSTKIDKKAVKNYIKQLENIIEVDNQTELLKMAIRMPEVLIEQKEQIDNQQWKKIDEYIDKAVEEIIHYRTSEAKATETDFKNRISQIENHLEKIKSLDSQRIDNKKIRLKKALEQLETTIDENRFEQELIYYLEKFAIDEEIVRLTTHLNYFLEELESEKSNGKKMGFIAQEIGREINTIGSKSSFAPMQKIVVQIKDELEKIKEQILNVL